MLKKTFRNWNAWPNAQEIVQENGPPSPRAVGGTDSEWREISVVPAGSPLFYRVTVRKL